MKTGIGLANLLFDPGLADPIRRAKMCRFHGRLNPDSEQIRIQKCHGNGTILDRWGWRWQEDQWGGRRQLDSQLLQLQVREGCEGRRPAPVAGDDEYLQPVLQKLEVL